MFRNRRHAGELLAARLERYRGWPAATVLALPRGGVPVAAAVARALALPLDIFCVRKLGAPRQPELAIGAVAAGGLVVLDRGAIASMGISQDEMDAIVDREREELARRERLYRGARAPLALAGRTAILIDDGVATGYTMLAASRALRRHGPARIVVAVPVAPPETLERLRDEVDEVVSIHTEPRLVAVGQFYEDFGQVSDEEVIAALGGGLPG